MNTTKKLNCVNGSSLMLVNDERQICEFQPLQIVLKISGQSYKTFQPRNESQYRQFSIQYDSRVVIYEHKMFKDFKVPTFSKSKVVLQNVPLMTQ